MTALILIAALLFQQPAASPNFISGQIRFFDGEPAAGTGVLAVPISGEPSPSRVTKRVRTDAEGRFRFEGLPEGTYLIQTVPLGPHTFFPGVATETDAIPITIAEQTGIGNINFVLTAATSGVTARGRLVVPEGQSIPSGMVVRFMSGNLREVYETPVAADGSFEVRHVRPGFYTVLMPGEESVSPVQITVADRDLEGIELALPPRVPISGTVAMETGGPAPPLTLTFVRQGPFHRAVTQTGADGMFTTDLPSGDYWITVGDLPPDHYIKSIITGSVDLMQNPLEADTSAGSASVSITLGTSQGVSIAGRVLVEGDSEASPEGRLVIEDRITGRQYETPIAAEGAFELQGVMPGRYSAAVLSPAPTSPPAFSLTIPESSVRDMEITVPGLVEIAGRVGVDGSGPLPRFKFALVRTTAASTLPLTEVPGQLPSLTADSAAQLLRAPGGNHILDIAVNALPDGTFRFSMPAGEYRMATIGSGVPAPFLLRSVSYGSARLVEEAMVVPATGPVDELVFGFGVDASNPWLRVSGRVTGVDPAASVLRVSLESARTSAIETPVLPDGSFEFPRVLRDSTYTARIVPELEAAPAVGVMVADQDVGDVTISVPRSRNIVIRTVMDGNNPLPAGYLLSLTGSSSAVNVSVQPAQDGRAQASLPEDPRRVQISALPFGYVVQSVTYGSLDLLANPLKIFGTPEGTELRVVLAVDPAVPFTRVEGRISAPAGSASPRQLILRSAAAMGQYETAVSPDGSFSLAAIPQGLYAPAVSDGDATVALSPALVAIGGGDITHLDLTATAHELRNEPPVVEPPAGARVTDLGAPAAGETAAVTAMRIINTALFTFLSSRGRYGSIAEMIEVGLLPENFAREREDYQFAVVAFGKTYAAAAIPVSAGATQGFFSGTDAVVRYSPIEALAPAGRNGSPVQ